jgi:hypothetical protein
MSWGYWGIVTGLAVLLTVFFVSLAILYSGEEKPGGQKRTGSTAGDGEQAGSDTKHAA